MALVTPQEMDFPKTIPANGMIDVPPQNKAVITAIMGGCQRNTVFSRRCCEKRTTFALY